MVYSWIQEGKLKKKRGGKMVQSQRVPKEWNKDCMCISQLSQVQFSPSGIFDFILFYQIMEPGATWNGCHIPSGLHRPYPSSNRHYIRFKLL